MSCLDRMVLSIAQAEAARDDSPRVLVAAGAGSGKTSLLVAYFIRALLDEGVPVERLVAVTFTRKAAGELAQRIRTDLEKRGRFDLARSLDAGAIGTIHSLCRRILRQNALEAGVDPAFAVIETDAAELLKREAAAQVWEEAAREADDEQLAVLAGHEKTLRAELVPLYDRLRNVGYEAPRLDLRALRSSTSARERLEGAIGCALDAGCALPRRTATLDKALDTLRDCLDWVSIADFDHPSSAALTYSGTLFPTRIRPMEAHFEQVREALTVCRHQLAQNLLEPLVDVMNVLLTRFHERYGELKRRRGVLDFADLELRTRALLAGAGSDPLPLFGEASRVMIDEFQDTNELQCSILEGLGAANVLMVGDERQSIYRFRGADVEVFTSRRDELQAGGGAATEGAASCRLHRLDRNYRSRAEVLAFINHVFAQGDFFGPDFVALECGAAESRSAAESDPAVEIIAADRGGGGEASGPKAIIQQAEAQASARRVAELIEGGVEPRGIVILSPALTHADLYQDALRERHIPAYVVRGKGYYSREEIADIRCLLQVLVNPHDDLAWVTLLRSPMVGLSDDALYLLGRASRGRDADSLWAVARREDLTLLPPDDRHLLDGLTDRLTVLRRRVGRPGLAALIDDVITDLGYDVCVLASDEGKRRFANIRKLMRLADEFELLHGPDLAGFVRVLATMEDVGEQEGNAATLAEEENVVRVMTVHQAKGLEFPVVLLTGLGSQRRGGGHPSFVVDNQGRAGVFLKGSRRDTYEDFDLCLGPAIDIVREEEVKERQEEVRLLYVAMTRAKKRLILVGARPEDGGLEGCRLGQIVGSLGLGTIPGPGERVALPEVHASVLGMSYEQATPSHVLEEPAGDTAAPPVDCRMPPGSSPCEPHPVRTPRRLSFSSLSLYRDCPRRFYLERVLGLSLDPSLAAGALEADPAADEPREALLDKGESGDGRQVGLLVHALLERSVLHGPAPSLDSLRALATELTTAVSDGAAAVPPSAVGTRAPGDAISLSAGDLERAVVLARSFWSSPVARSSGLEEALKEAPFAFLDGDILLSGIMDLVWEAEGRVFVVDYKTNSLRGRSPSDLAASYALQTTLYALAALQAGAAEVQMDLLFLERPEEPVGGFFNQADVPCLETTLEEALRPLRAGEYPAQAGADCGSCPHAGVCGRFA